MMLDKEKIKNIFYEFKKKTILVIGDLMVDEYITGDVNRISPEAPVPIVEVKNILLRMGGAGNVVSNIIGLGGNAFPCGVIGDDKDGAFIQNEIWKTCELDHILIDNTRPTTKKTRIFSDNQQMLRIDTESKERINDFGKLSILSFVKTFVHLYSGVIISDYQKGLLDHYLLNEIISFCRDNNKPVFVDPKGYSNKYYRSNFITPNLHELSEMSGVFIKTDKDISEAGKILYHNLELDGLIVTRGKDGISVVRNDGHKMITLPTRNREVFDVSGAGDTVISMFTLAYVSGTSVEESAELANLAAACVVSKVGTATTTLDEILEII